MRCKVGDLAVIEGSKSHPKANGMLVEIVAARPRAYWLVKGFALEAYAKSIGQPPVLDDDRLRPLRDNPGADETLTWRSVPTTIAAPAPRFAERIPEPYRLALMRAASGGHPSLCKIDSVTDDLARMGIVRARQECRREFTPHRPGVVEVE